MKTKLNNIGLEVSCIAGGLLSWTGENFRPFCFERGDVMSRSKKNLLELALDAWEKMTDNQRNRFNDFLYRLVVKGEKFTDEQIIQMVSEGV